MGSKLKALKPLLITAETNPEAHARAGHLIEDWNQLIIHVADRIIPIAESIYYITLEHYINVRRPLPLIRIAQLYNRRIANILNRAGLPVLTVRDLCTCLSLSETVPLACNVAPRGGILLLPKIVAQTYASRVAQGQAMPDFTAMIQGLTDGPELSPAGLALASAPFEDVPQNVTASESSTESYNPPDAVAIYDQQENSLQDMANSSTPQPETE